MVPHNIERKVRLKAALIYLVAGVMGAFMLIYLYQAQEHIKQQRIEMQRHADSWETSLRLIRSAHESQALYARYIATQNPLLLQEFNLNLGVIDRTIDTLQSNPQQSLPIEDLRRMIDLLNQQSRTTLKLKQLFEAQNPLNNVQSQLRNRPKDGTSDSVFVQTFTQKQVIKPLPKKGFFKRIAEAFSPSKDSITETIHNRRDTLIRPSTERSSFSDKVGQATQEAEETYNKQMHSIESTLTQLITSNQTISSQITSLLFSLQEESFDSIRATINRSEAQIRRIYTYSIAGAIVAILLILLLIVYLLRNINQLEQARKELEKANQCILQIMESRHRLLLSVSHDLKTPISSILGYLESVRTSSDLEIRSMYNSGNYMLTLLENLLEFSALEQRALRVTNSRFTPHLLFEDIAEMFYPIAAQKELCLTVDNEIPDTLIISSDSIKIKQIAVNLLSNALKYTQEGGVGWVIRYQNGWLTLEVTDTGAGIAPSLQEKLFQPFSRIEQNNHMAHGSGLGLFVIKGLIDLLKGTISLESEEGKGSRFTIQIPVEEVQQALSDQAHVIAIIDDDPSILQVLTHLLHSLGHTVHIASPNDTFEGCDLIITDLEMGAYSGLDVLHKAKDKTVVLMTGRSEFTKEDALNLGFADYLPKPFNRESIRMIVGEAAAHRDTLCPDDEQFAKEIRILFEEATRKNCDLLKETLSADDFEEARAICHKMIPSFAEFGYDEVVQLLRTVDSHRTLPPYKQWKDDVAQIIQRVEHLKSPNNTL